MYRTAVTGTRTAYMLFNWYVLRPEVQLVLTCSSLANIFNAFLSVCISIYFPVCSLNRLSCSSLIRLSVLLLPAFLPLFLLPLIFFG
jgi:hypothetical protein